MYHLSTAVPMLCPVLVEYPTTAVCPLSLRLYVVRPTCAAALCRNGVFAFGGCGANLGKHADGPSSTMRTSTRTGQVSKSKALGYGVSLSLARFDHRVVDVRDHMLGATPTGVVMVSGTQTFTRQVTYFPCHCCVRGDITTMYRMIR